ncbi:error-prone DNA polymerase, DnaE-like [Microlunatus sagamiharensis]|uniref:Error-prone DNA polymerase n=1 Tax=Microlunatus sagamiharensis TaxID=546874 RepID=A0A1H2LVC2_9ACTN|nr:error-prone DNA polymerase [Microlunatus sagamiharensis]SDU84963.1 error-prone DNA polymerase, DnaE-like [Microlunatus sagamiharensis]
MGWSNPPQSWSDLERALSGRRPKPSTAPRPDPRRTQPGEDLPFDPPDDAPHGTPDGRPVDLVRPSEPAPPQRRPSLDHPGDDSAPGYSHKRPAYSVPEARPDSPDEPYVPYAELHAHSDFSFLDGASDPESLIEEAARLRLDGLALTDHDGFYAAARFAEAAKAYALSTVYGAELSLGLTVPQNGVADPEGEHLLVLARGVEGYHRLSSAITAAQLRGDEKGRPLYDLDELAERADGHWLVLSGCRKGPLRSALHRHAEAGLPTRTGIDAAGRALDDLVRRFGRDNVAVEISDAGLPTDSTTHDVLAGLAAERRMALVATQNVHFATPDERRLAAAMAAVRARRSLTEMDGWLPPPGAHLRSGHEMAQRFARFPGAVATSVRLAGECAFDLQQAKPRLPKQRVPPGHTPATWLRELCRRGLEERYPPERHAVARDRLERELAVIEEKDFPGYFLIVRDMVAFAREQGILCQGRGSAANSVVCYVLMVTAVDPILYDLPFERFLSVNRDEEPDIDVDFDSDRREEVIQEVYRRYGRHNAAQVANVISYRPKSAVRDMAKALGHSTGQQDAWSKQIDSWGTVNVNGHAEQHDHDIPTAVVDLAEQLLRAPRHLGIHSGGMVLTERPVGEVVPIERGRMDQRTVLQWDKDSCAWMGLVKFDFLGLGILAAIQYTLDLAADRVGERWDLDSIPKEEQGVYDMLCRADSIGVFQVESRAQIGTLPRLQPRRFYDLVVEIGLIRPGPIQGGAVHPYIRRATGKEEITYLHPALKPVLERTKGIPLFQEQLMQIAMTVGGCTGDDADLLRRAMGSKRGVEKIERLRTTLYEGMALHGIVGDLADDIYARIQAFANFGFAESHSISFGLLVYASSWLKLHYPGAFLAGLLRAQPMGFYSSQSLVADARRHGVQVRRPDIVRSDVDADLEVLEDGGTPPHGAQGDPGEGPWAGPPTGRVTAMATGMASCTLRDQPPVGPWVPGSPDRTHEHRRDGRFAVRLGLSEVQGIGRAQAQRIVDARADGPFTSINDVVRRTGLSVAQTEALATAGAFDSFGLSRRQALWNAGYADSADTLPGTAVDAAPPELPGMSAAELTLADLWATQISPDDHPVSHLRPVLDEHGVLAVSTLGKGHDRTRVRVAGLVTHRQRPSTAGGVTFLNLEDETGMLNIVCSRPMWQRFVRVGRRTNALLVRGTVEHVDGVTNLVADRLEPLSALFPKETTAAIPQSYRSRDFR